MTVDKIELVESAIKERNKASKNDNKVAKRIIAYIENIISPHELNNRGQDDILKLTKKFSVEDILEAIEIASDTYLKFDSNDELETASINKFLDKIGGVIVTMNRPLYQQKMLYIKGICRNRFNYWSDYKGTIILENYVNALRDNGYSDSEIAVDLEDEVIPNTKKARNWSSWRDFLVGWTNDLKRYASEKDQEESIEEQPIVQDQNKYVEEKRKGGENSYKDYQPLKAKVKELCCVELEQKNYSSASQLCNKVASIIQKNHSDLLAVFQPYINSGLEGNDWKRPTFYGWCNTVYKKYNFK